MSGVAIVKSTPSELYGQGIGVLNTERITRTFAEENYEDFVEASG
jgi:hypothetical protein